MSRIDSDLSQLPQPLKTFFGYLICFSFVFGSIGKFFIYDQLRQNKLKERPINVLIFMDEMISHSLIAYRYVWSTTVVKTCSMSVYFMHYTYFMFNLKLFHSSANLLIILLADQQPVQFWSFFGINFDETVFTISVFLIRCFICRSCSFYSKQIHCFIFISFFQV